MKIKHLALLMLAACLYAGCTHGSTGASSGQSQSVGSGSAGATHGSGGAGGGAAATGGVGNTR